MIHLGFSIRNPFWRSRMNDGFRNYLSWEPSISENKFITFEITRHWYYLFKLNLNLELSGSDHAGPNIDIELFGYGVSIALRDKRHWNDEEDRWYLPGESIL